MSTPTPHLTHPLNVNRQRPFVAPQPTFTAGKPKVGDDPQTLNYREFKFSNLSVNTDGVTAASVYPLAKRMATFRFTANAAIIGISLTSAITNLDSAIAGVFLLYDAKQPSLDVSSDAPILVCHISQKNSLAGTPVSANRTNGITFSDSTAMKVNGGQDVGLYVSVVSNAGNLITALAQFVWIPIPHMR